MVDLSEDAIQKRLRSEVVQNPLAIISGALGGIFLLSGALFSKNLFFVLGAGCALLSGALYAIVFLRRDQLEIKLRYKLLDIFQKEELNKKIELIKRNQETLKAITARQDQRLTRFSDQAYKQYDLAELNFSKLKDILSQKLNPQEQTFIRLYGMSQQLYFCILDNLESVTMHLDSAIQVDENYIHERLKDIENKNKTEVDEREIITLNERLEEKIQLATKVDNLLTSNEEALTKIIKTMRQIAEAHIDSGKRASVGMAFASESLDHLLQIVKRF